MRTMVKSFGWLAGQGKSSRRKHVAAGKRRTQRQSRYSGRMPVVSYLGQAEDDAKADAQRQADAFEAAHAALVEQYYQAKADARQAYLEGQQALLAGLDPAAEPYLRRNGSELRPWEWDY
jgi:hypothetical protein